MCVEYCVYFLFFPASCMMYVLNLERNLVHLRLDKTGPTGFVSSYGVVIKFLSKANLKFDQNVGVNGISVRAEYNYQCGCQRD